MRILELFAGIGACSIALKNIGLDVEIVDAVEIDKYAMLSFNAIHNTNFQTQDITKWDKDIKNIDLITHGSPCQDFSVAGKQAGGDAGTGTRSSLMYETVRIVGQIRPKYILWENVKNLLSKKHRHNFDNYINEMDELGYNSYYQVLNAKDYGVPQNRERVYTVSVRKDIDNNNFKFPNKEKLDVRLKDILKEEVEEKYYLSQKMIDGFIEHITDMQGGNRQPKIIKYNIKQKVKVRKYSVDTNVLQTVLRDAKKRIKLTNKDIAHELSVPTTQVEHYFRTDGSFAIPDKDVWLKLKELLHINTNEFDKSILTFEEKDGIYEKANRIYDENGIAPTLTQQEEKVFQNFKIRKLTPVECWRLMRFF